MSWQAGTFSSTLPFVRETDIIVSTALHQFENAGLRHLLGWQKQIRDAGGELTIAGQGELDREAGFRLFATRRCAHALCIPQAAQPSTTS